MIESFCRATAAWYVVAPGSGIMGGCEAGRSAEVGGLSATLVQLMPEAVTRRFGILDAMVLVVATAVGLAVTRIWVGPHFFEFFKTSREGWAAIHLCIGSIAFYWALALILLRLRGPRPPLRLLRHQPGLIACLAVALSMLYHFQSASYQLIYPRQTTRLVLFHNMLLYFVAPQNVAPAVALSWIVLFISRGWEPEAGWIDRLSRAIGVLWLCLYIVDMARIYYNVLF